MRYPRILSAIRSARWAVSPPVLHAIVDTLGAHLRGHLDASLPRHRADDSAESAAKAVEQVPVPQAGPALIKVHGIIGKHLSDLEMECGGCDVDAIAAAIDLALATPEITSVLLDIDSPGGVVTGVPELAERIRAADAIKPIYAFTSAQCCSAAYWIASAARWIYCSPSSDLGSIGVYVAIIDDSEWWQREGYKLELMKAGEYKAMGISGRPLSDAERALIQADVDAIYEMFTADILRRRPGVESSVMQGQTFLGRTAVAVGLADQIANDRASVLRSIATVG